MRTTSTREAPARIVYLLDTARSMIAEARKEAVFLLRLARPQSRTPKDSVRRDAKPARMT